ncbi:unnamed protein product [Cuscuta epithymum]|uniref:Mitochondrial import inner membrane translocase subunit TIM50 n=1 Tax=Cuscuta epithymum TaxID=186058 RepID=A0AAV0DT13_9ASTE|nr:unnamed protein product [Cuscuta epithymum]
MGDKLTLKDLDLPLQKLILGPRKKLLVLCLGGLLVHRVHIRDKHTVRGFKPDYTHGKFRVFKRPFCNEFLDFCFDRFVVGLWSSAMDHNIDDALRCVIGDDSRNKLAFFWSQMQCRDSGYGCPGRKAKPVYLKRLKDLWDKKPGCHNRFPWEKGQYSASNTLLIDTEPHVSLLNPVNTAIFPEPFKKPNPEDAYLGPNGELQRFLEGLSSQDIDVPTYVKDRRSIASGGLL